MAFRILFQLLGISPCVCCESTYQGTRLALHVAVDIKDRTGQRRAFFTLFLFDAQVNELIRFTDRDHYRIRRAIGSDRDRCSCPAYLISSLCRGFHFLDIILSCIDRIRVRCPVGLDRDSRSLCLNIDDTVPVRRGISR